MIPGYYMPPDDSAAERAEAEYQAQIEQGEYDREDNAAAAFDAEEFLQYSAESWMLGRDKSQQIQHQLTSAIEMLRQVEALERTCDSNKSFGIDSSTEKLQALNLKTKVARLLSEITL